MTSPNGSSAFDLLLVPTQLELDRLAPVLGGAASLLAVELCGFGPVAAAARAAQSIGKQRPQRVILAGLAGTFCPDVLPLGAACCFRRVTIDGIGAGESNRFISAQDLGFSQVASLNDELPLEACDHVYQHDLLLTCCAAADSADMAAMRRQRHPSAVAEDMEGFAVALTCHLAAVPLTILRGVSNIVGDREKKNWVIDQAIHAVGELLRGILAAEREVRPSSPATSE